MVRNKTFWISLNKEYGKYLNTERKKKNDREENKSRTVSRLQSKTAYRRKQREHTSLNDFDLYKGCIKFLSQSLEHVAILNPFGLNYMTSDWDNQRSLVFVIQ